jgi:uncharacterized surface protein with fasciclin (FAS1) repeats
MHRLLTATAVAALCAGLAVPAAAQTAATAKTEAQAKAATGKASSDKAAATQPQGTARAVQQGAGPAAAAQGAAPAASASAAQTAAGPRVAPAGDIVETARAAGHFTTFLKAVDATNLTGVLKNNKNLTVFVPTDAAFAALPAGQLDKLMADKAALQKLMTHHVINAPVDSSKFAGARGPVPSVAQDNVMLDGSQEGVLKVDGATIVQADIRATNGILHVVDRVLIPGQGEAAAASGSSTGASANAATPAKQ